MGSPFPLDFPQHCSFVLWLLVQLWKSWMSFWLADIPKSFLEGAGVLSWLFFWGGLWGLQGEVSHGESSLLYHTGPVVVFIRKLFPAGLKLLYHYSGKSATFWYVTPHSTLIFRVSFSTTAGGLTLGLIPNFIFFFCYFSSLFLVLLSEKTSQQCLTRIWLKFLKSFCADILISKFKMSCSLF